MNHDAVVVLIAAVMCIAAIVAWVWLSERLDSRPRGRHEFTDPADISDPDGTRYIGALMEDPPGAGEPDGADVPDFWDDPSQWPEPRTDVLTAADTTLTGLDAGKLWNKTPAQLADDLAARYLT